MKAYLLDLSKDCECITHDGPCWLQYDRFLFEQNLKLLASAPANCLTRHAFFIEEGGRLREKIRQEKALVKREDIQIVLPDGYNESDYTARTLEVWRTLLREKAN